MPLHGFTSEWQRACETALFEQAGRGTDFCYLNHTLQYKQFYKGLSLLIFFREIRLSRKMAAAI